MANKRTAGRGRAAERRPRSPSRGDDRELSALALEMAQLTEAERMKRWLRGMRVADEVSQRLRAAEDSKRVDIAAGTRRHPGVGGAGKTGVAARGKEPRG